MNRVYFLVCVVIVLLATGCTQQPTENADISLLKTQVSELQKENQELKEIANEPTNPPNDEDLQQEEPLLVTIEPTKTIEPKTAELSINTTVSVPDICEFMIKQITFAKRIDPPNPGSFYSYYEAKEPNTTLLDTVVVFKNLQTSGKPADEFGSVKVFYNEKYEYRTYSVIEERNGEDFTYTNITSIEPLKNGVLHYLAEVPSEVETSGSPVKVELVACGKSFTVLVK